MTCPRGFHRASPFQLLGFSIQPRKRRLPTALALCQIPGSRDRFSGDRGGEGRATSEYPRLVGVFTSCHGRKAHRIHARAIPVGLGLHTFAVAGASLMPQIHARDIGEHPADLILVVSAGSDLDGHLSSADSGRGFICRDRGSPAGEAGGRWPAVNGFVFLIEVGGISPMRRTAPTGTAIWVAAQMDLFLCAFVFGFGFAKALLRVMYKIVGPRVTNGPAPSMS